MPVTLALFHCLSKCEVLLVVFLFLQFTDIGTFETVWQVKFYNYHKRDHCQWGSPFSVIEYECKPNETRSLMWVNKESFL
ncbi:Hypothetical predicted protein [Marmota monax]|uniref:CB1 cannabinoid receptor-interacting protein 1 n=1 Tax=Marmota monax TaxID=9995 RepID=A0A5E4CLM0_MARMO|nr:hypothetical protein GHT09_005494 [Marmota monax]VTJ81831.1 Hypothetical predicted protein [Marmota monax]